MTIWHCTKALVSKVAAVHHLVQIGISQNHASKGNLPPSPIIGSMANAAPACDGPVGRTRTAERKN